jgi:hypothetical protein
MSKHHAPEPAPTLTLPRACRLYRLLSLTAEATRSRKVLLTRLKVDVRGFYRDLELLRALGIEIACDGDKYQLAGDLNDALAKLPFPDPGLSFRDVLTLSRGTGDAHKKLRRRMESFTGPASAGMNGT